MKKLSLLTLLLVFSLPLAALAQEEAPKAETFVGYSILRLNPGSDGDGINMRGFNSSLAVNINKTIGIVAEFSRSAKTESVDLGAIINDPSLGSIDARVLTSTFLFGPRFTLRGGNAEPFVHVLFGGARGSFKASSLATGVATEVSDDSFAYGLGGGLDIKLHDNFAIRLAQLDYVRTKIAGERLNNLRYSVGFVIRFGKR